MVSRTLTALIAAVVTAWNDCAFPEVGYFAMDELPGISYTYALAAMNGNMYSGGYTKGHFAMIGVTDSGDVAPVPGAAIFGQATSNVQNLYISETDSSGSMLKSWWFKGSAIQVGQIGHGKQTNSIDAHSGLHKMMDNAHLAVKGGFRQLLQLPDGTSLSSASRLNTNWQVPFVMKLDVSKDAGVGPGTTGWHKLMDDGYPGGAEVYSVDGDASGNMIVSFKGCASFDATATGYDRYGRTVQGAATGCTSYLAKLAASDGAEVWKHAVPTSWLSSCRVITDGSTYCGWSMSASSGTLDFGNGVTVVSEDSKAGIVKFDANGDALWAKATASHAFGDLAVSADGSLLVIVGSAGGYGSAGWASRISTLATREGDVLWSDQGGVGTHGFRGVEVTDDNTEVFVFGQVNGETTMVDTNGESTMLRSRGSYEAYIAAYDAADGSGKYAMDGGGTGMEYFFAFAKDPSTNELYVGGTSRSEYITWGAISRKNVMYNGQPGENNPDTSSAVGSSKAFVVQIKTADVSTASCLNQCNAPLQALDVKAGYCYIDRYCYADGAAAPYSGYGCYACNAATPLEWSGPDTTNHCFIDDKCVQVGAFAQVQSGRSTVDDPCQMCDNSKNTTGYSAVAGCLLPTSSFQAGCYEEDGTLSIAPPSLPPPAPTPRFQKVKTTLTTAVVAGVAYVQGLKAGVAPPMPPFSHPA
jgi:hypothetical protein